MIKEGLYTISTRVIVLILSIMLSVILNRMMGPAGKGIYTGVIVFVQTAGMLFFWGYDVVFSMLTGKRKVRAGIVSGTLLVIFLVLSTIFTIIMYVSKSILENVLVGFSLNMFTIPMMGFLFFSELWLRVIPDGFLGRGDVRGFNLFNLFNSLIKLIVIGLAVFLLLGSPAGGILGYSIYGFIILVFSLFIFKPDGFNPGLILEEVKHIGIWIFLSDLFAFLLYRFDFLLLNGLKGSYSLGIYSTAVFMGEVIWLVPVSFYNVIYAGAISSKKIPERRDFFIIFTSVIILGIIGCIFIKPVVLFLYGKDFLPVVGIFRLLLPGIVFFSIPKVLNAIVVGKYERPAIITTTVISSFLLNLILDLILIPVLGGIGAAIGTSISYTTGAIIYLFLFVRLKKWEG